MDGAIVYDISILRQIYYNPAKVSTPGRVAA